jgi:hypothetical protein
VKTKDPPVRLGMSHSGAATRSRPQDAEEQPNNSRARQPPDLERRPRREDNRGSTMHSTNRRNRGLRRCRGSEPRTKPLGHGKHPIDLGGRGSCRAAVVDRSSADGVELLKKTMKSSPTVCEQIVLPIMEELRQQSEVPLDSKAFRAICAVLNSLKFNPQAGPDSEYFSGGIKFSDESPGTEQRNMSGFSETQLIDILRVLWAYRMALVQRRTRADLADTWNRVLELAPSWPGFTIERCSEAMLPLAQSVMVKSQKLSMDIEELDRRIREKNGDGRSTR